MPESRYLVTIGTFDGVHRGHQKLIAWVIRRAKRLGLKTRAVFFILPPRFYFKPGMRVPVLTTSARRAEFLKSLGVDKVEILRFGPRWAAMEHDRFFKDYILRRWRAGGVCVGRDFGFGKGRKGDPEYLRRVCSERGLDFSVLPLSKVAGRKISSSDIRELLLKGDVVRAARLLGRNYFIAGKVARGKGLGRALGTPTANLSLPAEVLVPPGVFEVRVHASFWRAPKAGVCNVGVRPTLNGRRRRPAAEVHLPGFSGSLYGRTLSVEFLRRLRAEKKFPSLAALKSAIRRDILRIRAAAPVAR